jgi:hypothetical protein
VLPNPSHMGGDVVVVTMGILASCNILQHPLTSLIRIHCKHWGSSGICGIGIGIKVWSSGSNEACLCTTEEWITQRNNSKRRQVHGADNTYYRLSTRAYELRILREVSPKGNPKGKLARDTSSHTNQQ